MLLVLALAFHVAEVGLIGLMVIVLATSFTGVTDEHRIGKAFEAALPFTALLVVFFAIVAVIHDQHLFEPVIQRVLAARGSPAGRRCCTWRPARCRRSATTSSSRRSTSPRSRRRSCRAPSTREQFEALAVAINTGTNIPSVATPNGQAAFLFLLTSTLAPLIRLGYVRMVWMALPYFVVMTVTGWVALAWLGDRRDRDCATPVQPDDGVSNTAQCDVASFARSGSTDAVGRLRIACAELNLRNLQGRRHRSRLRRPAARRRVRQALRRPSASTSSRPASPSCASGRDSTLEVERDRAAPRRSS